MGPGDPGSALWAARTLLGPGCPRTHRPLPSLKSALGGHASVGGPSGDPDTDHLHQEQLCTAHGVTPTNKPWRCHVPCPFWTLRPPPCRSTFLFINTNWSLLLQDTNLYTVTAARGLSHLRRGRGTARRLSVHCSDTGYPGATRRCGLPGQADRASRNFTSANPGEMENQQGRLKTLKKG